MTPSFPSGHSMLAAVTYLPRGGLPARALAPRPLEIDVMSLAMVLSLLMVCSRI